MKKTAKIDSNCMIDPEKTPAIKLHALADLIREHWKCLSVFKGPVFQKYPEDSEVLEAMFLNKDFESVDLCDGFFEFKPLLLWMHPEARLYYFATYVFTASRMLKDKWELQYFSWWYDLYEAFDDSDFLRQVADYSGMSALNLVERAQDIRAAICASPQREEFLGH